jgi:TonB-dependent starch-binding outer membrane protein SusC
MRKKVLLIIVFACFYGTDLFAQEKIITGKVTSREDGQGLPGVNVLVQGTARGTTTDVDGNYKISLEPGDKALSFSFIGYKPQVISLGNQSNLDVVLDSEATNLQEVIVVGYGTQKKSDITGSTANIKGEELSKQPVLTATQAIQGKVAGVQIITSGQPGSSPQIRVRGLSTALAATTSLFVVDGVLTDDISNINTADIIDMTVLKDASASAIYGSRGANGVIIITTRKGVSGKMKITYNTQVGFRQAANLVPMANSLEYANYVQASTGIAPPSPQNNASTNWYGTILRNALEQTHNLSLSGGTDKSTYLFNVGYMNDQGILLDNTFKRLTLRLNSEYFITDQIKLGVQASYSNSINQNGFNNINIDPNGNVGSVYNDAYRAAPIIPNRINGLYGNTSVYQNVGNPLLDLNDNSVKVANNRLQGSTYLQYKPVSWLSLKSSVGADWQNTLSRVYDYAFLSSGPTNVFLTSGGNQVNPISDLSIQNLQTFRWVWDNTATVTKKINKHDFTLLAGTTAERYYTQLFSGYRNNVPPDPSLWYLDNGNANSSQNTGNGDEWTRNSYLARLNYGYDGRYLLTATVRRDGSSRLPSQNRWQNYPSFGAGWVLSNETFMQTQQVFDFLKLRASYGKVGNDQIPTSSFTQTVTQNQAYPFGGSLNGATPGSLIQVIIDPHITWEVTTEYDLAVEFALVHSKLSGEVNYYNKQLNNGIDQVPILGTVGANPAVIISNVMGIQNKGVEVLLNWKDRITENLSYTVSGNVTFNKNQVTALNNGQNIYDGAVGSQSFVTNTDVGHPVGSFYVLKTIGVFNSAADVANNTVNYSGLSKAPGSFKYLDKNGDGVLDPTADRIFAGSYQPVAYYGINLGVKYKNWDFGTNIYGNSGNKVYNGKRAARVAGTDNIEKALVYNRWTPSNLTQSQPAANSGNLPASTYFVESGSFVRINNLTIGYTFTGEQLKRLRISNFRVFAMSQNLFTYKRYSGFTSELPGTPTASGIETSTYPTTRTVALGVNVGF